MTPGPGGVDLESWGVHAAQCLIVRQNDIENVVAKSGRLRDFKADMAAWSRLHDGQGGSVSALLERLHTICDKYQLLSLLAAPKSPFGGANRSAGGLRAGSDQGKAAAMTMEDLAKQYRSAG
jgi:hypothetical protein